MPIYGLAPRADPVVPVVTITETTHSITPCHHRVLPRVPNPRDAAECSIGSKQLTPRRGAVRVARTVRMALTRTAAAALRRRLLSRRRRRHRRIYTRRAASCGQRRRRRVRRMEGPTTASPTPHPVSITTVSPTHNSRGTEVVYIRQKSSREVKVHETKILDHWGPALAKCLKGLFS